MRVGVGVGSASWLGLNSLAEQKRARKFWLKSFRVWGFDAPRGFDVGPRRTEGVGVGVGLGGIGWVGLGVGEGG